MADNRHGVRTLFGGLGLLIDANSSQARAEIDAERSKLFGGGAEAVVYARIFPGIEIRLLSFILTFTVHRISNINGKRIPISTYTDSDRTLR